MLKIELFNSNDIDKNILYLAEILFKNINLGASIGFLQPFNTQKSINYWKEVVTEKLESNKSYLFAAKIDQAVVGCVQLVVDMPENQLHRAEIAKLLVHPQYQKQGIGKQLMLEAENAAKMLGKKLLVLDTKTEDSAKGLYLSLGYQIGGCIPNYALNPELDKYASTTIMYKHLA